MCHSEFNDIAEAVAAMDADVISFETSRSRMELLEAFATASYPNEIGLGVRDNHSPSVPTAGEKTNLLRAAKRKLRPDKRWQNPDCELKTRGWVEERPAVASMVEAARRLRTTV